MGKNCCFLLNELFSNTPGNVIRFLVKSLSICAFREEKELAQIQQENKLCTCQPIISQPKSWLFWMGKYRAIVLTSFSCPLNG